MSDQHIATVRLDPQLASDAKIAAEVIGVSVNELLSRGLKRELADLGKDETFRIGLQKNITKHQALLERLAKT